MPEDASRRPQEGWNEQFEVKWEDREIGVEWESSSQGH